jgi:hypothetical protein
VLSTSLNSMISNGGVEEKGGLKEERVATSRAYMAIAAIYPVLFLNSVILRRGA